VKIARRLLTVRRPPLSVTVTGSLSASFEQRDEPQGPKVNCAVGSMEWQAQIKKERIAREAAEEVRKQIRVARVAALLERGSQHAAE
jgi:hypothetical protein